MEAACNVLLSHYNFQFKIKEKQLQVISFSTAGYFCGSVDRLRQKHTLRVAAFDLGQGKDKYCTVYGPVPNRLPVISMSTRFHDKTIKLLKWRIIRYITSCCFFFFCFCFFCKRFLCVFKRVSTQLNLFVCNILSKRTLKLRPSAQNTFIDVTTR